MVFTTAMKALVEELIAVLSRQLGLYSGIRDLLEQEREALLSKKPSEVLDLAHRKETLLLQIRVLEESRELICLRLAKRLKLNPKTINISEIEKCCGDRIDPRLGRVREELRRCVGEIQEGNAVNSRLCQNGIDLIERIIRMAAEESAGGDAKTYGPPSPNSGDKSSSALQGYRRAARFNTRG